MIVAIATDDGMNLANSHFGDAKWFYIYEINGEGYNLIAKVENTLPEEKMHGDPNKAKGIAGIMQKYNIQVLVGFVMGPNIIRMKKEFVPVISRCKSISDALKHILADYKKILTEVEKDGEKEVLFVCQ